MTDKKAFTLIELLVVVAIIGILAAVGVVAYNGYTSSAKVATIKSNHKLVIKNINLILLQCETNGSVQLMSNKNDKNTNSHTCFGNVQAFFPEYFVNHMNNEIGWKNNSSISNWNGSNTYVLQEGTSASEYEGFVFLSVPSASNKQVSINVHTCFKSPCNNQTNRIFETIYFMQ